MSKLSFTDQQQQVIAHTEGHARVIACAGSGKTTTLVERVARLVQSGIPPNLIAVVQYNKAAQEDFQRKLNQRLGQKPPEVRTFHSIGHRITSRLVDLGALPTAKLYTGAGAFEGLARRALTAAFRARGDEAANPSPSQQEGFGRFITLAKSTLEPPASVFERYRFPQDAIPYVDAFSRFERDRVSKRMRSFDDLIFDSVGALEERPELWRTFSNRLVHLMLDEYQDVSSIQHLLALRLAGDRAHVCAVGDPQQTIYTWRGADINFIEHEFAASYPGTTDYALSVTFRYGPAVAMAANALISHQSAPTSPIVSHPSCPPTRILHAVHEDATAPSPLVERLQPFMAAGELHRCAFLVRNFSHAISHEIDLLQHDVPYHVYGREPLIFLPEIGALVGACAIAAGHWPVAEEHVPRILNAMLRAPTIFLASGALTTLPGLMHEQVLQGGDISQPLHEYADTLDSQHTARSVRERADIFQMFSSGAFRNERPEEVLGSYLRLTDFTKQIARTAANEEAAAEMSANVNAFLGLAKGLGTLTEFLDKVADMVERTLHPPEGDHLRIHSCHAVKGREFDHVFLGSLSTGSFPSPRAGSIEEERRLCYVGMTRAMQSLTLVHPNDSVLADQLADLGLPAPMGQIRTASRFVYEAETACAMAVAEAITGPGASLSVRDPRVPQTYLVAAGIDYVRVQRDERNPEVSRKLLPITRAEDIRVGDTIHSEVFGLGEVLERPVPRVARVRWSTGEDRLVVLDTGAWTKVG